MRTVKRKDIGVGPKAHPLVKAVAVALYAEGIVHEEACRVAGVHKDSWQKWRREGRSPNLDNFEALAQVAGLRLVLKPIYEKEKKR